MGASLYDFTVLSSDEVAEGICRMRIECDAASVLSSGQFLNLAVPGDGSHILRIPLSFSATDAERGIIEIVFAVVGEGTARLSAMGPGSASTLLAPLGHGWRIPTDASRVLLVAGGIGLPPVAAAARLCADEGVGYDAIVGARTAASHVTYLLDELRSGIPGACEAPICHPRVIVTTDDGSLGIHGFVTHAMEDLLAENRYDAVLACGPNPMLAGVAALAERVQAPCQVSLERMMGCGFGACSCCNVALRAGGYALCCTDGPVFDAREVAW